MPCLPHLALNTNPALLTVGRVHCHWEAGGAALLGINLPVEVLATQGPQGPVVQQLLEGYRRLLASPQSSQQLLAICQSGAAQRGMRGYEGGQGAGSAPTGQLGEAGLDSADTNYMALPGASHVHTALSDASHAHAGGTDIERDAAAEASNMHCAAGLACQLPTVIFQPPTTNSSRASGLPSVASAPAPALQHRRPVEAAAATLAAHTPGFMGPAGIVAIVSLPHPPTSIPSLVPATDAAPALDSAQASASALAPTSVPAPALVTAPAPTLAPSSTLALTPVLAPASAPSPAPAPSTAPLPKFPTVNMVAELLGEACSQRNCLL